jgi:hypothetical protein
MKPCAGRLAAIGGAVVVATLLSTLHGTAPADAAAAEQAAAPAGWKPARTVQLDGLTVTVSEPVLVGKSKGYLWFPTLLRLHDGRLLAIMSDKADVHTNEQTGETAVSTDGGLTWGELRKVPVYSECPVHAPDGDILLPNYLFPQREGVIGAPYLFAPRDKPDLVHVKEPLTVGGWPRPPARFAEILNRPDLNVAGFLFNGQTVTLKDGRFLATLYGYFEGDKRYSLVTAASRDGRAWAFHSPVAGADCKLEGGEGPCEAAVARLKDGRLVCVFRLASNVPYGRSYSGDDGATWTEPQAIDARSVQPSLAVMPDGLVALSGGRPGVSVWFSAEGDGDRWQPVELLPGDASTSAYTEIVPLDADNLLCVYDRIPHGWNPIPEGSAESNSVWVVRLTVNRAGR